MEIEDEDLVKELEKMLSTPYQTLPKRHLVETLIVSVYASQDYDAIGADISQLEETGVAHFFTMTTRSMEELVQDFVERNPEEELPQVGEDETSTSFIVKNATLLEWEDGLWSWLESSFGS